MTGLSIGQALILPGELPIEQEELRGSCFQLPVGSREGSRDGVAVYDFSISATEIDKSIQALAVAEADLHSAEQWGLQNRFNSRYVRFL